MKISHVAAVLAAVVLGAGSAAACGNQSGDRQDVNQGNEGEQSSEGGNSNKVMTGPTTLQSTGTQPTVTQTEPGK
jgi:hypothetical protein